MENQEIEMCFPPFHKSSLHAVMKTRMQNRVGEMALDWRILHFTCCEAVVLISTPEF